MRKVTIQTNERDPDTNYMGGTQTQNLHYPQDRAFMGIPLGNVRSIRVEQEAGSSNLGLHKLVVEFRTDGYMELVKNDENFFVEFVTNGRIQARLETSYSCGRPIYQKGKPGRKVVGMGGNLLVFHLISDIDEMLAIMALWSSGRWEPSWPYIHEDCNARAEREADEAKMRMVERAVRESLERIKRDQKPIENVDDALQRLNKGDLLIGLHESSGSKLEMRVTAVGEQGILCRLRPEGQESWGPERGEVTFANRIWRKK